MSLNPALAVVAACGTIFGAWFAAGKLTEESAAPDRNVREPPARAQPVPAGRVLALRRVAPLPDLAERVAPLPDLAEREPPPRPKPAPAEPAPAGRRFAARLSASDRTRTGDLRRDRPAL